MNPIVLLHPLGTNRGFWEPVLAALDADRDVVPIDLPGHGDTPALGEGADLEAWALAVLDQLDKLGYGEVIVVGVSLGGLIAQQLAAAHPQRVEALVLVDTVAVYPETMRAMWRERAARSLLRGTEQYVEPTVNLWFSEAYRTSSDPVVAKMARDVATADPQGYSRACTLLATVDVRTLGATIACPTLVVCGADDAAPFVEAAHQLTAAIPDARLAWLPGQHAAVLEHPVAFADLVCDAVGALPSTTRGAAR